MIHWFLINSYTETVLDLLSSIDWVISNVFLIDVQKNLFFLIIHIRSFHSTIWGKNVYHKRKNLLDFEMIRLKNCPSADELNEYFKIRHNVKLWLELYSQHPVVFKRWCIPCILYLNKFRTEWKNAYLLATPR